MNIHFGNQSQFELFPKTTGEPIENVAPPFIFSRVVLTFENLVVVFVFVLVGLIIAFSVGVERGKRKVMMARSATQVSSSIAVPRPVLSRPQNMPQRVVSTVPVIATAQPTSPRTSEAPRTSGTAEAARVILQPAPVLPTLTKSAPSEKVVDKGYTIQVASYKKESLAQKEATELKGQGLNSLVMTKGDYSIVCVGRFSKADEAKGMLKKLKKRYKDSMIRSL